MHVKISVLNYIIPLLFHVKLKKLYYRERIYGILQFYTLHQSQKHFKKLIQVFHKKVEII